MPGFSEDSVIKGYVNTESTLFFLKLLIFLLKEGRPDVNLSCRDCGVLFNIMNPGPRAGRARFKPVDMTAVISSEKIVTRTGWKILVPFKTKFSAGLVVSSTTVTKKLIPAIIRTQISILPLL